MYYKHDFGSLTRYYREKKKMSQEKLAELCGVSSRCISDIERGKTDPRFQTVLKICYHCDIDVGALAECKIEFKEEIYKNELHLSVH